MQILKVLGITFLVIYFICFLRLLLKSRKPLKYFFINALFSFWLFAVIELTGFFTSFHIPLNYSSIGVMSFGGIPAVLMLLIFRIFIF